MTSQLTNPIFWVIEISRYYNFKIEIENVPKAKEKEVMDYISENIVDSTDNAEMDETEGSDLVTLRVIDNTSLCGGEGTDEAHLRITEEIHRIVPEAIIKTSWHEECWTWDNEYDEDSLEKIRKRKHVEENSI